MADKLTSLPMFVTPLMSLWLDLTSGLGVRQKRYCLESCGCRELTFPNTDLTNSTHIHSMYYQLFFGISFLLLYWRLWRATTDKMDKLPGYRGA